MPTYLIIQAPQRPVADAASLDFDPSATFVFADACGRFVYNSPAVSDESEADELLSDYYPLMDETDGHCVLINAAGAA